MMNKQEVIDEIENAIPDFVLNDFQRGKGTGLTYALELVEQLNDPEKPVVPQFIDTWIPGAKYNGFDLYEAMTDDEMPVKVATWIANNPETFAKAWLYGYEVEKEKLYTVEIPNPNGGTYLALCKDVDGKLFFDAFFSEEWKTFGKCKLTESEIKEGFAWAWKFAEEVKE